MDAMKRVGLNTRWYRYQKGLTQEKFSEITNFKMAYISVIESGNANLTCRNIDVIARSWCIDVELLFSEKAANKAINLPMRVYMYKK